MILVFSLADMINHLDCFRSIERVLDPGDKSHLVMVNNILNVVLDSIGWYLLENFCICVHQGYWSITTFLVGSLSGFRIKVMLAS